GRSDSLASDATFPFIERYFVELANRSIGKHNFASQYVIDRLAEHYTARAARIIADHPTDRCTTTGGRIGSEMHSMHSHLFVQSVADHTRLHARPVLIAVLRLPNL